MLLMIWLSMTDCDINGTTSSGLLKSATQTGLLWQCANVREHYFSAKNKKNPLLLMQVTNQAWISRGSLTASGSSRLPMLATLLAAATLTSASLSLKSFRKGGRTSDLHIHRV